MRKKELKKEKEIIITENTSIRFPENGDGNYGNLLVLGNFNGVCGGVSYNEILRRYEFDTLGDRFRKEIRTTITSNIRVIIDTIKSGGNIVLVGSTETIKYFTRIAQSCIDNLFGGLKELKRREIIKQFRAVNTDDLYKEATRIYGDGDDKKTKRNIDNYIKENTFKEIEKMSYTNIIQNPPYNGSYHLDFLTKGLDLLTETGRMVIIEPATWLINVRKNGKVRMYNEIKKRIEGHVESVVIENLNKEFNVKQDVPFSVTTIDMSKTFETIDFVCCGEHSIVNSIYDCNLIGENDIIFGIFNKVKKFGGFMKEHFIKPDNFFENENRGLYFLKFTDGYLNALGTNSMNMLFDCPNDRVRSFHKCGEFGKQYIECASNGDIVYNIIPVGERGNKCFCVYGTIEELENWKHFIFNNKLPLFLNIVLTIDQHNNSKDYLPWLVDRHYTDDEINEMFGFTKDEIKLIETTIKKYERNSPWFRRYVCGKNSVSDNEVQEYINKISE